MKSLEPPISCAVPGCGANSKFTKKCTFHRLPRPLIPRTRWIIALGPLPDGSYVCSQHFDASMFTRSGNARVLVPNAVPKPLLFSKSTTSDARYVLARNVQSSSDSEDSDKESNREPPDLSEGSEDARFRCKLVACRVCLATDGRLYAISGSGLEDSLAELTGVAVSAEKQFPHHLCAFCFVKLVKCAAFRDCCQRSTTLLETILKKGPLKMNALKAFSQRSQELTHNFTVNKVYQFETSSLDKTTPFIEITPLTQTAEKGKLHEDTDYTEVEYLDGEDFSKQDASDDDGGNDNDFPFELPNEEREKSIYKSKSEVVGSSSGNVKDRVTVKNRRPIPSELADHMYTDIIISLSKDPMEKTEYDLAFEKEFNFVIKVLSKEEQKQKIEERIKAITSEHSCGICGKHFGVADTLARHKASYHDQSLPLECDVCCYRFRRRRDLNKHQEMHRTVLSCAECGLVSPSRLRAREHYFMHQGAVYACGHCQASYSCVSSYYTHVRLAHADANEACAECGDTFTGEVGLAVHRWLRHRPTTRPQGAVYACGHCQASYSCVSSYYTHVRLAHADANEACAECGDTFTGEVGLAVHRWLRHRPSDKSDKDFECKVCKEKFSTAEALQRHEELSVGVSHAALFPCGACGDSCGSDVARAAHMVEKHPPDQHYCKECNKTFSSEEVFARHAQLKHGVGGAQRRRAWAARVRRVGPAPGPLVCELCGATCNGEAALESHMNGHLGLKPFQCPRCPKAFPGQRQLQMHLRRHTGERPYLCEQCPRAFSTRGNFQRHVKSVHLKVQVSCDKCGKQVGAASLASHIRAVHMNMPYVRRKRDRARKKAAVAES